MPTYFDVISFSDVEIDETTQLYLVQTEDKRFALRACSIPLLADLKSDLLSRSEHYWPIDKAWLPNSTELEAFSKIFSCDGSDELGLKLTTELLTRENVKDYLKVNPLDEMISDHAMGSHEYLEVIDNVTQLKSRPFDQKNPQLIAERRLARIRPIANNSSAVPDCFRNVLSLAAQAMEHRTQLDALRDVFDRLITTARDKPSERESIRLEVNAIGLAVSSLHIQIEEIVDEIYALREDVEAIGTIQCEQLKSNKETLIRLSLNSGTRPSEIVHALQVMNQSKTLLENTTNILRQMGKSLLSVADIATQSSGLLQAVAMAFSQLSAPIKESAPTKGIAQYSDRLRTLFNTAMEHHARWLASQISGEVAPVILNDMVRIGNEINAIEIEIQRIGNERCVLLDERKQAFFQLLERLPEITEEVTLAREAMEQAGTSLTEAGEILTQASNALTQVAFLTNNMIGVLTEGLPAFLQTSRASALPGVESSAPQERAPTPVARSSASTGRDGFLNSRRTRPFCSQPSNKDDATPSSSPLCKRPA